MELAIMNTQIPRGLEKLFEFLFRKKPTIFFYRNPRDIVKDVKDYYESNKDRESNYDLKKENCQHFVSKFLGCRVHSPEVIYNFLLLNHSYRNIYIHF